MSFAQNLAPGTDSGYRADSETIIPLEPFGGGVDDARIVLPSSDSIRSTKSDNTVSSWQTSSSASTQATSIASSLSKTASIVLSGISHIARPNKILTKSRWIQEGSLPQPEQESVHTEDLPLQLLSNCGTYAGCNQIRHASSDAKVSASIRLTFDFGCRSHVYELEYAIFRQWKYISLLVSAVHADGMSCALMWDESEGLQVMAGDWEARVTPGWQVTIFCQDDHDDEDDDDWSEVDSEKDEPWDVEKGYGGEWWFKRWKTRVEKKKEGQKKKQKAWIIGVVAAFGIAIAFCMVSWVSSNEHRPMAMG
jgi:hypothetical protein